MTTPDPQEYADRILAVIDSLGYSRLRADVDEKDRRLIAYLVRAITRAEEGLAAHYDNGHQWCNLCGDVLPEIPYPCPDAGRYTEDRDAGWEALRIIGATYGVTE